jgi:hypothetical protein
VFLEIGAMSTGFNKAIADAKNQAEGLNKKFSAASMGMSTSFAEAGKQIGTFAAVAGVALVAFGLKVLKMGMDNEEAMSKFNTIYGDSAASVREWADTAGAAMGRSSRALQGMAADVMALVAPMAATREAAIAMSTGAVQAAEDLASFNNVPVADALAAIRSGLTGEAEPLKRFGIQLSDAALQEYALTQNIRKKVSEMSTAEKLQLRYNAVLNQMGAAAGDAVRTSGSLTNQLKALSAVAEDGAVSFGAKLVPATTELVMAFRMAMEEGGFLKTALDGIATAAGVVIDAFATILRQTSAAGRARQQDINEVALLQEQLDLIKERWGSVERASSSAGDGVLQYGIYMERLANLNQRLGSNNALLAAFNPQAAPRTPGATRPSTGANEAAIKALETARKKYEDIIAQSTLNEAQLIRRAAQLQQEELFKSLGNSLADRETYAAASVAIEQEAQRKITEVVKKAEQERRDEILNRINTISSTAGGMVGQLGALFQQDAQNRTSALDIQMQKEMETIGARYEAEKGMIEQSGDDATTKAAKLKALDEKRAREEKTLRDKTDKDKRKIEREAAKRAKQIAIAETLLAIPQMAIQSYKALAGIPVVGPALGAIAAATATALGMAKLALIYQTPLPEAATGMYGETPFIAGERGPELAFSLDSERGKVGLRTFAQQLIGEVGRQQSTGATVVSGGTSNLFRVVVNLGSKVLYDDITRASENGEIVINARSIVGA